MTTKVKILTVSLQFKFYTNIKGCTHDFIDNPLVGVEVKRQTGVIFLNEHSRGPLCCFRADAALFTKDQHDSHPIIICDAHHVVRLVVSAGRRRVCR
jgi:hypothetical protein